MKIDNIKQKHKVNYDFLMQTDAYHLTMGYLIEPEKALQPETHVVYARSGGPQVVGELAQILQELLSWRLTQKQVANAQRYWSSMGVPFAADAWRAVVSSSSSGRLPLTVRGVKDGEVVLPGDPIASITAPAVMAAVIEPWLISRLMKSMQLTTRFSKLAQAVNWDYARLFEVGLRASSSIAEHSASVATLKRAGLRMTSSGCSALSQGIVSGGSMGHRFTQRYANDYQAFGQALGRMLEYKQAGKSKRKLPLSFLLDTRSTLESGLPAAIKVIQERAEEIKDNIAISLRLDSGDLEYQLASVIQMIRRELTDPLLWPGIIVESGLDAEAIERLEDVAQRLQYPLNKVSYGVGGFLVGAIDRDFVSMVYKLSDINGQPVMKFADESNRGKESYPGKVTLVERSLTRGVRRLVAQEYEAQTLSKFGWKELFHDLVIDGEYVGERISDEKLQLRIRTRWESAAQSYIGRGKFPTGFPLRPQLSPVTRRIVDWLRHYRMDAEGKEIPEISCSVKPAPVKRRGINTATDRQAG